MKQYESPSTFNVLENPVKGSKLSPYAKDFSPLLSTRKSDSLPPITEPNVYIPHSNLNPSSIVFNPPSALCDESISQPSNITYSPHIIYSNDCLFESDLHFTPPPSTLFEPFLTVAPPSATHVQIQSIETPPQVTPPQTSQTSFLSQSPLERWSGNEFRPSGFPDSLMESPLEVEGREVTTEFRKKVLEALGSSPLVPQYDRLLQAEGYGKFLSSDFPPLQSHLPKPYDLSQLDALWGLKNNSSASSFLNHHYDANDPNDQTFDSQYSWVPSYCIDNERQNVFNSLTRQKEFKKSNELSQSLASMFGSAGATMTSTKETGNPSWTSLTIPLTFKPDVASWSSNDDLLLGGPNGQLIMLNPAVSDLTYSCSSIEFLPTPLFCFESFWKKPGRRCDDGSPEFYSERER